METEQFSLTTILKNDPDFAGAFVKRKTEVIKDKENLLKQAINYNKSHEEEILEGDKLRQRMITEGKKKGFTESEIFKGNKTFYPTVRTPILNFLYFMLQEPDCQTQTIQEVMESFLKTNGYEITDEVKSYMKGIIQNFSVEQKLDEEGDDISLEDVTSTETTKELTDLGEFLYGELTVNEFKTVKKLKSLSKSDNEEEAFSAYRKCLELCKKYNLEFDKIPCNIT